MSQTDRRTFLKTVGAAGLAAFSGAAFAQTTPARPLKLSLATWSLHRMFGGAPGQISVYDFPRYVQETFGISGLELVSYQLENGDKSFKEMKSGLRRLMKCAAERDVRLLLVMVDSNGDIGGAEDAQRAEAVEKHKKWIDVVDYIGGHSMRMNWTGATPEVIGDPVALRAFIERSASGLRALCEHGEKRGVNVIIENHGGPSSYPEALLQLIADVDHPRFGTLPDFGNFPPNVDRYQAVDLMMNYARAVSAKCYDFDPSTGEETKMNFHRLLKTVWAKHNYQGYVGIEYEGDRLSEKDGVLACKALIERVHAEI